MFLSPLNFPNRRRPGEIRALSLLQPWASLMAFGEKFIETRSWATSYRGLVAIAASARWKPGDKEFAACYPEVWNEHGISVYDLPLGKILCVGWLDDCIKTEYIDLRAVRCGKHEDEFGNYARGRYAWIFASIQPLLRPVPVKGSLGLYSLAPETLEQVRVELAATESFVRSILVKEAS